jgi:CHAD domain-containing protein
MKYDSGICILAAKAVPNYAGKMLKLADEIRRMKGEDAVHDMRVAGRRLRTALTIFSYCFPKKDVDRWLKQVRGVTRTLGVARDLDVQILAVQRFLKTSEGNDARAGMERLLLRLEQKRKKADKKLLSAVTEFAQSAACDELRMVAGGASRSGRVVVYDAAIYRTVSQAIAERLTELLAYAGDANERLDTDRLHAMRMEAKKLRYTMELAGELYEGGLDKYITAVKNVQTVLGNLHDYAVWIEFLPRFIEKERQLTTEYLGSDAGLEDIERGIEEFGRYCGRRRDNHYAKFMRLWGRFEKKGLWAELSKTTACRGIGLQ